MKQAVNLIINILLIMILSPAFAFAEAFSWTEPGGKVVYGTNPPKSASNVKSLSPRGLSTYSSTKVLNRLGWRGSLNSEIAAEIKTENIDIKGLELGVISEGDIPALENIPTEIKKTTPAKLGSNNTKITLDQVNSRIINRAKVEVNNSGDQTANNVAVAFEFRDGTLIPAAGPASIEAGKSATYKIPVDLVPLRMNFELSRKYPEKSVKVVLDWEK